MAEGRWTVHVPQDEPIEGLRLQLVGVTEPGLVEEAELAEPAIVDVGGGAIVAVVEEAGFAVPAFVDIGGATIVAEAGKPVFEPGLEIVSESGRALVLEAHMARLVVVQHSLPVAHMLGLVSGFVIEREVELGWPEPEYGTGLAVERPHGPEPEPEPGPGPEPEPEPEPELEPEPGPELEPEPEPELELLVEPIVVAEHRPH